MRTTQGLDCNIGPKMIVESCDSRKEPVRLPYDAFAGPVTSYVHPTVILQSPQGDGTMIVRSPCDVSTISRRGYIGYHQLFVSFQYLSSGDVSNTTTHCDSIWSQFSLQSSQGP